MSIEKAVDPALSLGDKMYNHGINYSLNLLEIRMKSRGKMTYQDFLEWRAVSFPDYKAIIDLDKVEL